MRRSVVGPRTLRRVGAASRSPGSPGSGIGTDAISPDAAGAARQFAETPGFLGVARDARLHTPTPLRKLHHVLARRLAGGLLERAFEA